MSAALRCLLLLPMMIAVAVCAIASDAVEISKLDDVPKPTFMARPQYPVAMRDQKIDGEVVVDFIVDVKGDVRNAYAVRSSRREFEAAAVAAVEQWRFQPGTVGGRKVNTHMQLPIVFTLDEEKPAPSRAGSPGVTFEQPTAPLPADTHDISRVDVRPVPRYQARPQYPFALRKAGTTGEAVIDFIVDTEGNVQRAFAIRATHPEFADAAVVAVEKWKFKPGMIAGRAVNTHMQVPIVFSLNSR